MNINDLGPCEIKKNPFHNMKNAGLMVGVDLENPIDCSQMDIMEISEMPEQDDYSGEWCARRKTVLRAFIVNEYGEQEELTIAFELKSVRRPKRK